MFSSHGHSLTHSHHRLPRTTSAASEFWGSYLVVVEGVQSQVVPPRVKQSESCQQIKHLHLHHDVGRVQS